MPVSTPSAVREEHPTRLREPAPAVRTDIQGLRALAVSLVLLFHLWPNRLTGGFVGVDVFFVISGFLITSHLLAHPPTRARDLLVFWARRIQRLLPASLLVLAVTVVGTRLFAPETLWGSTAEQIRAAALYVVNWELATTSVDYLAAEAAPSPAQHYWSLSIEEQFYLGWPVALLLLFLLARLLRRSAYLVVVPGIVAIVAASLWSSVTATAAEPAAAYFVTPTRIWELGVGGLLAALLSKRAFGRDVDHEHLPISVGARIVLAWVGFAAIAWTAVTYSGATAFPGWLALLPVLGTAVVIAVESPMVRGSAGPMLAWRPVQFLGDISYSVYLWHWPLVVLVPYATEHPLDRSDKLSIIAATVVLAALTKVLVEDRFREARFRTPLVKPFVAMLVGMALVVGMAIGLNRWFEHRQDVARQQLANAVGSDDPCFGAQSLSPAGRDCERTTSGPVVPAPGLAIDDKSDAYRDHCWEWIPYDGIRTCSYGDEKSDVSIALVGNSHAGHWLPALQGVAQEHGWHITTILASECTATRTPVEFDTEEKTQGCLEWGQRVLDLTADGDFDLVVTSERSGREAVAAGGGDSRPYWQEGFGEFLQDWADQGQRVAVVHDTPFPASTKVNPPDCIAEHEDDLTVCSGARDDWVPDDPLYAAARGLDDPLVSLIDLTDFICTPTRCDGAVGGVLAYFDGSHISATFSATLSPFLGRELVPLVETRDTAAR
jgi:peptidoglycan/LPS O-acetylase OafA/YrhL